MSDEFGFDDNDAFGVVGDEAVQEGPNYKTWENGKYSVKGIWGYMTKDERELPTWAAQGDQLVARFKLILLETRSSDNQTVQVEVEGPPMSANLSQMILLVRSFGGDVSALPNEATSKFLLDAQDAANRGGKVREASINKGKGWVDYVEGMTPPVDTPYTWELVGFRSPDNTTPVSFQVKEQKGNNGMYDRNFCYADFIIVGDRFEEESVYNGYKLSVKVNNPFSGSGARNKSGKIIPTTLLGQKGGIPIDVRRWISLKDTFFPKFQHDWEEDPEKSSLGINEISNPLAVVDQYVRSNRGRALVKLMNNRFGYPSIDLFDFIPARTNGSTPKAAAQPSELEAFYHYVVTKYGDNIFSPTDKASDTINLALTSEGIKWAKSTLVPLWTALELPVDPIDGQRYIAKLQPKQFVDLTNELRKLNGEQPDLTYAESVDSF